jgi:hypothetical protein
MSQKGQESSYAIPADNQDSTASTPNLPQHLLTPIVGALTSLTNELHTLSTIVSSRGDFPHREASNTTLPHIPSLKRKRTDHDTSTRTERWLDLPATRAASFKVAAGQDCLDGMDKEIVDVYFRLVHPWISILHEPSFRNEVRTQTEKRKLRSIVQAMTVVALRFVQTNEQPLDRDIVREQASNARYEIVRAALDDICVENVQALLILVFFDITEDNMTTAHSLLGIVWRHIESLEIHLCHQRQRVSSGILRRTARLPTAVGWIEEEEWRRIFWTAFMLDRLCATLLGQRPTSITSATSLKLPVCSSFWYTNQPHPTPYLHISDPSKAGLDHIIHVSCSANDESVQGNSTSGHTENAITSGMGSLAFYVETLESMSLVVTHFLSLEIDFTSSSQVSRWLTRFKDLDHYLMQ